MRSNAWLLFLVSTALLIVFTSAAIAIWVQDGVPVGLHPNPVVKYPRAVNDGAGGLIITWQDDRFGESNIYAARVTATGDVLWLADGEIICDLPGNQRYPQIASDGAGGAIIAWEDDRNGDRDIFAQRINGDGVIQWLSGGVAVCSHSGDQGRPGLALDGYGGAIICWVDDRSGEWELYAQRVSDSGAALWQADGLLVGDAGDREPLYPLQLRSDGANGAFLALQKTLEIPIEEGDVGITSIVGVLRISDTGSVQWEYNPPIQAHSIHMDTDGYGGVVFAFIDESDFTRAMRFDSAGNSVWSVIISDESGNTRDPRIASDGGGGALISWFAEFHLTYGEGYLCQHVDAGGTVQWVDEGIAVILGYPPETSYTSDIVSDGAGGTIFVRAGNPAEVRRIRSDGIVEWEGLPFGQVPFGNLGAMITSNADDGAIVTVLGGIDDDVTIASQLVYPLVERWPELSEICNPLSDQTDHRMVPDGAGGAIITWEDYRAVSKDIYVQRIDANGSVQWSSAGEVICDNSFSQTHPGITSDGADGAIICWRDPRGHAASGVDIFAQRIDGSGSALWPAGGLAVCDHAEEQTTPQIAYDNDGGAFIAWRDFRNGNWDIYAQRIDATGTRQWVDDVAVCTAPGDQDSLQIIPDGFGRAIITWEDYRDETFQEVDSVGIYAQLIDESGVCQWAADGAEICVHRGAQVNPQIIADGYGGAIITWEDHRYCRFFGTSWEQNLDSINVYVQRIDAAGAVQWRINGDSVCTIPDVPGYLPGKNSPQLASDGSGGAIVAWEDGRNGGDLDIYAQWIDAGGDIQWPEDGLPVCTTTGDQDSVRIVSDGSGGAVITWRDRRSGNQDIYAQAIDAAGSIRWTNNGKPVCISAGSQESPMIVSDGSGGAIIAWKDMRNADGDIYAQRVSPTGLVVLCEVVPQAIDFPDPVQVFQTDEATFEIANNGAGDMVGYVEESCDHFSIVSGGGLYNLSGGQSRVVTVRFEPTVPGFHQCTIETGTYQCGDVTVTGTAYECSTERLYVDADVSGGTGNGSSWTDALPELGDALQRAIDCPDITEIWVADGIYKPNDTGDRNATFQLQSGLAIYGGFDGGEAALEDRDLALYMAELSGDIGVQGDDSDNCYHVVTAGGTDATAKLDGFVITGGNANGDGGNGAGGGIFNVSGSPSISNIFVSGNDASNIGGGMYNYAGDAIVVNAVFYDNHCGNVGGGVCNMNASPTLLNVTFSGNTAVNLGNGMGSLTSGSVTLANAVFWGNASPEISTSGTTQTHVSHSLVEGGLTTGCVDEGGNIYTDPMFVDAGSGNLRLDTGSPAIDAGDNTPVDPASTDLDGLPRILPTIGTVDMGAYEFEPPPLCSIDPVTLDFDVVPIGGQLDLPFTITNQGGGTLSGTVTGCGYFSIESGGTYALGPDESQVVMVRYAPTASGAHACDVETGNSSCGDVSCTGGTPPVCALSTTTLDFETVDAGSYQDMYFTITNTGGGTLTGSLSLSCPYYSISGVDPPGDPYELENGEVLTVTVRFAPTIPGEFTCDVGTGCAEAVACTGICGTGGTEPLCDVTPESFYLGRMKIIDQVDKTFTITNIGGGVLTGSVFITPYSPHASIISGGSSYSLSSGDSRDVTVRFHPQLPGHYNGLEIHIGHDVSKNVRLAYVAQGASGLNIYECKEKFPPTRYEIGSYSAGTAYDVAVSGFYAYVTYGADGMRVIDVSDPTNPSVTGMGSCDTPGSAGEICIVGSNAYVADADGGLQVIDISNPASPVITGTFNSAGSCEDVVISGSYAYIADGSEGLTILDISLPMPPDSIDNFDTPGTANGVFLDGDYAYVADGSSGLRIIDVSGTPTEIGYYDTDGDAQAVAVSDGYAYVADGPECLQIIDVSDPSSPSWVSYYSRSSYDFANDVVIMGCIAYVADGSLGMTIALDVSDPTDPFHVWLLEGAGDANGVDVRSGGDVLLYADVEDVPPLGEVSPSSVDFGRVAVGSTHGGSFTIRNVGAGSVAGTVGETCSDYDILSGDGPFSLAHDDVVTVDLQFTPASSGLSSCLIETGSTLCDRLVLVANRTAGLSVFNAMDPETPVQTGTFNSDVNGYNVFVSGNYAYVAGDSTGFHIIDISDPAAPILTGSYDTPGSARGVFVSGDIAYVADLHPGLHILDISVPAEPTLLGSYNSSSACGVVVRDIYAYLADGSGGLRIFDISDPTNPILRGTCPTPPGEYSRNVSVRGDYAYVANGIFGIHVIDVSDPFTPTITGTCGSLGYAWGIDVSGDFAYVADASAEGRLRIVDVSIPSNPVQVWQDPVPRPCTGVRVSGRYAYVAASGTGLVVFDVFDPGNPVHITTNATPATATGVAVREGGDVACAGYAGYEHAVINSVMDVPDDQGGYVRINITRSIYDFVAEKALPISSYQAWRRVDDPGMAAAVAAGGSRKEAGGTEPSSTPSEMADGGVLSGWPLVELNGRYFVQSPGVFMANDFPAGTWEIVENISPTQQENYIILTPTLADSSSSGIAYAVYVITAHTTIPSIWFASEPDSGYSVDNIAPAPPLGFSVAYNTGSGNQLSWDPSPELDFHCYRIYRGLNESFIPGPGNLVNETSAETWTDPGYDGWDVHYKITALDYAGNESNAASPASITGDDVPSVPKTFALYQNVPNPFNPMTTIRFDLPRAEYVNLCVYNVKGELVAKLVDRQMPEGHKEVVWTAEDERGRAVSSGVYFYRLVAGDFVQTRKMVLLR